MRVPVRHRRLVEQPAEVDLAAVDHAPGSRSGRARGRGRRCRAARAGSKPRAISIAARARSGPARRRRWPRRAARTRRRARHWSARAGRRGCGGRSRRRAGATRWPRPGVQWRSCSTVCKVYRNRRATAHVSPSSLERRLWMRARPRPASWPRSSASSTLPTSTAARDELATVASLSAAGDGRVRTSRATRVTLRRARRIAAAPPTRPGAPTRRRRLPRPNVRRSLAAFDATGASLAPARAGADAVIALAAGDRRPLPGRGHVVAA